MRLTKSSGSSNITYSFYKKGGAVFKVNITEKLRKIGTDSYARFDKAAERLSKSNRINLALIAVICFVSFAIMLFLNGTTHFAADDFAYNFVFLEEGAETPGEFATGERLNSISDVFNSMRAHYNTVNGRVLLHFIVQFMMLVGKPVFNVCNSLVFVALVWLIYLHSKGRNKNHSAAIFCMAAVAVWTFVPGCGVTLFWLDGSVNYMWGSVIRLAALLPFRYYADGGKSKNNAFATVLMLVLSFAAGATNENTSAALIGMMVLYIALFKLRKYKVCVRHIACTAFAVAGYLFMTLAPATGVRMDAWGGSSSLKMLGTILYNMSGRLMPFVAVTLMLVIILMSFKDSLKPDFAVSFISLAGAVAAALVLVVSNYFPDRAWFGSVMLGIISCGALIFQLRDVSACVQKCLIAASLCWAVWGGASVSAVVVDSISVDAQYDAREAYIEEQKALGNYDLTVRKISPVRIRSPHHGLADLSEDPENRRNRDMAKYYGLNSIVAGENDEY